DSGRAIGQAWARGARTAGLFKSGSQASRASRKERRSDNLTNERREPRCAPASETPKSDTNSPSFHRPKESHPLALAFLCFEFSFHRTRIYANAPAFSNFHSRRSRPPCPAGTPCPDCCTASPLAPSAGSSPKRRSTMCSRRASASCTSTRTSTRPRRRTRSRWAPSTARGAASITLHFEEPNSFVINSDSKEFILQAENHESMMIWLLALQANRDAFASRELKPENSRMSKQLALAHKRRFSDNTDRHYSWTLQRQQQPGLDSRPSARGGAAPEVGECARMSTLDQTSSMMTRSAIEEEDEITKDWVDCEFLPEVAGAVGGCRRPSQPGAG
uniref:PH domain-containing protein n=1 Tax=Macrostomum lignano TaxID=282301 RepID=A0A1I8F229_9PLAT